MSFDYLALAAVRDELEATLTGGHIQRVFLTSRMSASLEVYQNQQRHRLLLSAHPQYARIHLTRERLTRDPFVSAPFLLLLRKHVLGGTIVALEQPELERVVHISIEKKLGGDKTSCRLAIEVMGRHSNLVLVGEDGVVLDAIKRVPPSLSQARPLLPHLPYRLPPEQPKARPAELTGERLHAAGQDLAADTPLWQVLVRSVRAVSPQAAREIAARATGNPAVPAGEVDDWSAVLWHLVELFALVQSKRWEPSVAFQQAVAVDFAPYRMCQYQDLEVRSYPSLSAAADAYLAGSEVVARHEQLRARLRGLAVEALERLRRKEAGLRAAMKAAEAAGELRRKGEAIYTHLAELTSDQTSLQADDPVIALDPRLGPSANAQRYFREYGKARQATAHVPDLLAETTRQHAAVAQLASDIELARGHDELRAVEADLRAAGIGPAPGSGRTGGRRAARGRSATPLPEPVLSSDGLEIYAGRNARQNERITFELARPDDLWLHVREGPGAHVLVRAAGGEVPPRTLAEAAQLAAYFSPARGSRRVEVVYTQRRQVRKIAGAVAGMVTYSGEHSLTARPTPPRMKDVD